MLVTFAVALKLATVKLLVTFAFPVTCSLLVPSSVPPSTQRPLVMRPASLESNVPSVWNTIALPVEAVPTAMLPLATYR